jgi:poly(3-hydroxybutyrate) depolymerase
MRILPTLALSASVLAACHRSVPAGGDCAAQPIFPGVSYTCLVPGWPDRDFVLTPAESALPDLAADGTSSTLRRWSGCRGGVEVDLLTVRGGGHTWPGGDAYLA